MTEQEKLEYARARAGLAHLMGDDEDAAKWDRHVSEAELLFPECARTCELVKEFGVGECEALCPSKFKAEEKE